MGFWTVSFEPKSRCHVHTTLPGLGHPLLVPPSIVVLRDLRVSAGLTNAQFFWVLHAEPSIVAFELEHGAQTERTAYNGQKLAEVRRTRKLVRGRHRGFSDLFVPVVVRGEVIAALVLGPFSDEKPSAAGILSAWRKLTGRQGHPVDPEFAAYLAAALSTLVLDRDQRARLEQLLVHLARLLSGEEPADHLANTIEAHHVALRAVRHVERVWDAVRSLLDDRFPRTWSAPSRTDDLRDIGLHAPPDHVLVALTQDRRAKSDPVELAVRLDAFQRASVELARDIGRVVSGQVGGHGVVFLASSTGKRSVSRLLDLASELARRSYGLELFFGSSNTSGRAPLSQVHQAALGAAESALAKGQRLVVAEPSPSTPAHSLRSLRSEVGRIALEQPGSLRARFDGYMEAVAVHCGHRLDPARTHLEVAFDRMGETLAARGALEEKGLVAMRDGLERAAAGARTLDELFAAYRRTVSDVANAVEHPVPSRRDRSLRRAVEYIHEHYAEAIRLDKVARLAGFTPSHFSRLFASREGMPFVDYVAALRLERAKQLLAGTNLDATRVAELAGYASSQYFSRVFRKATGATPIAYRRRAPS